MLRTARDEESQCATKLPEGYNVSKMSAQMSSFLLVIFFVPRIACLNIKNYNDGECFIIKRDGDFKLCKLVDSNESTKVVLCNGDFLNVHRCLPKSTSKQPCTNCFVKEKKYLFTKKDNNSVVAAFKPGIANYLTE